MNLYKFPFLKTNILLIYQVALIYRNIFRILTDLAYRFQLDKENIRFTFFFIFIFYNF